MSKKLTPHLPAQEIGDTEVITPPIPLSQSTPRRKHTHSTRQRAVPLWKQIWRERWMYLLLLPGVTYFLVFYYFPLLGNVVAFQEFSPYLGFFKSPWVGFENFVRLFKDPMVGVAVRNTLVISFLQIVFAFPAAILLALLLNALVNERFKRLMQSIVYLPHFLGWVIIISIWNQIFGGDGFVTHLVTGLGGEPIDMLTNPDWFKPMIVLQVIWKESGWGTIMILAAIAGIEMSQYEAAVVDGANKWQRLWHVTLPGIRSIIILLLILRLGNVLSVGFEQIFLQRNGVSLDASEVIDTFSYARGLLAGEWGFATAVALVKAVIGAVMIFTANTIAKKFGEEGLY